MAQKVAYKKQIKKMQTKINNSTIRNPQPKLPTGWQWVRLGEVCEINPRRNRDFTRSSNELTTFIPMSSVNGKSGAIIKPEVVPYSRVAKGYTYFEENDVLFAKITPCMQNGKHLIARNLIDRVGLGTTEFHVLRPKEEILPEWIHFFIRQPLFLKEATSYFTGAVGQQRVPKEFLSNYIIPISPLSEQKRIASKIQELMQEIDKARTACEKQMEAVKALPSAYLREVFESEEAKNWERKRMGEVCEYKSGIWGEEADETENCYYILRSNNIKDSRIVLDDIAIRKIPINKVELMKMQICDILVVTSSGSKSLIGKCAIFDIKDDKTYLFSNFTMRLRPNLSLIISEFLYRYLISPAEKDFLTQIQATTTGLRNLDRKEYIAQSIPVPILSIQQRIASELKEKMAEVEKLCTSIEKQLEAINALPQAILRKAFRGEL